MRSSRDHRRAGTASVLAGLVIGAALLVSACGATGNPRRGGDPGGDHRWPHPERAGGRDQPAGGADPDRSAAHAVAGTRPHNGTSRDRGPTTDVGRS